MGAQPILFCQATRTGIEKSFFRKKPQERHVGKHSVRIAALRNAALQKMP